MRIFCTKTCMRLSLHSIIIFFKTDLLLASFIKPRIDSISATVYGKVETLEVKPSMRN